MARIRKLVLAIAAASALTSGVAHALGLGEVTLQSALNQPLVAEIELLEVRDLAASEVLPRLASLEDFSKAGVEHPFFLNDLTFTPVIKPNGKNVIRVSSSKPVREPYLNFLVEVIWPNGRLLREYTVLLDPPLYSPQAALAIAPQLPVAASQPAAPVSPQGLPAVAPPPAPAPARTAVEVQSPTRATASNQYRTVRNDTLWEIAQSVGGGSVQQTMLAIQDLNPDAFVDQNINRLKTGQVLRLPDKQQVKTRSRGEAIARVAEQNAAWQAWRQARSLAAGERQLDATKRSSVNASPERIESGDSLRLVSGEQGQATVGQDGGGSGDSKAVQDSLAVAKESLDTSRRESADLQGRVGDLQSQMEKLERLIELKDSQLARLQSELVTENESLQPISESESVGLENVPLETVDSAPEVVSEAREDFETSATVEAAETIQPAVAVDASPAEVDFKHVAEEPGPQSLLNRLLADPLLLGAVGGGSLLILLLALMVLSRRNAMREAELREGMAFNDQEQNLDRDLALPNNSFDELHGISAGDSDPDSELLGEANIYIAYGRFNQAAELLLNALDNEPERRDLRLKLMEVFAEQGDRSGFVQQENELGEIGGADEEIRQLKYKYPNMASSAPSGAAMAGAAALATGAYASQLETEDTVFSDLSFDDPDMGNHTSDLGGLDFTEGLQLSPALSAEAEPEAGDNVGGFDELDFDLQLDDEADATLAREGAVSLLELPAETLSRGDDWLNKSSLDAASLFQQAPELTAIVEDDALSLDGLPDDFDLSLPEDNLLDIGGMAESADTEDFEAELQRVNAELDNLTDDLDIPLVAEPVFDITDLGPLEEDEFDFLSGTNETATKLDLARAYIDMGDNEGARDILDEVLNEGDEAQQGEARELIGKLS